MHANTTFMFIANWKMQRSFDATISFCNEYKKSLQELCSQGTLVICPSFTALQSVSHIFSGTSIAVGAQNCSEHSLGAYTGQESAESLAQVGCTYCIVGHSEARLYNSETDEAVAAKALKLVDNAIIPIICIGESRQAYLEQTTLDVLTAQLEPVFTKLRASNAKKICIAYEPIWSIGTGIIPEAQYLERTFLWIKEQCSKHLSHTQCHLLYGGSVTQANAKELSAIPTLNGLLIGGASLDFQKFKNIVSLR